MNGAVTAAIFEDGRRAPIPGHTCDSDPSGWSRDARCELARSSRASLAKAEPMHPDPSARSLGLRLHL